MLARIGLPKSGNLMNWWKLEQGDLFMNNHPVCSQSTRTNLLLMTMIWTLTPTQNQTCRYHPDHSCTGWMIECERFKTNPQKMQHKTVTNHSLIWRMFMSFDIGSICIHGKNYSENLHSIKNTGKDLNETDVQHIWKVDNRTIRWDLWSEYNKLGESAWKHLSLIGDEEVISLSRAKVYVFSDSVLWLWKDEREPHYRILSGRTSWRGSKVHGNTELWTQLTVSQLSSSGIFS